MKKIVFLIIASLLVLGLVLPGCDTTPKNEIVIAVCGPLTDLQGQNHLAGAQMARDEINAAGGVDISGTNYTVKLVEVETKEATEGEDGTTGSKNLLKVVDDVTFCVGGFRTEVLSVYREKAMDAKKIFMNCGAATGSLQYSVLTNYDRYKYWFMATPYNESFLVTSLLKIAGTVSGLLKATLYNGGDESAVKADYKVSGCVGGQLRAVILMEDAKWCENMVTAAQAYLPLKCSLNVTRTILVDPTATTIGTTNWANILADKPHIIFTAFSGSVGARYSIERVDNAVPAVTIGINVPGQQLSHWGNTNGKCKGEIMLDTWAAGLNNTSLTSAWFNDYVDRFDRYPVYTAGTYDAIKQVCKAIDVTNSLDSDVLVPWLENPANAMADSVASDKVMQYPLGGLVCAACGYDFGSGGTPLWGLNETQVLALYPDLASYNSTDWQAGFVDLGGNPYQLPHFRHDLVYGPGYATGIGAQWQYVGGAGAKVGVWPMYLDNPNKAYWDDALTDQYGNWNFKYDGTMPLDWTTMLAGFWGA